MTALGQPVQVRCLEIQLHGIAPLDGVAALADRPAVHLYARDPGHGGAEDQPVNAAGILRPAGRVGAVPHGIEAGRVVHPPLGDDRILLRDLVLRGGILVVLAAAAAVPVLDVALGAGGGGLGGHVHQIRVVGGVEIAIFGTANAAFCLFGACRRPAGAVLGLRVRTVPLAGAGVGVVAAARPRAPLMP